MVQQQQQHYHYGTGRRKTAIARVRLYPGTGQNFIINGKPLVEQFPLEVHRQNILSPLQLVNALGRFDASVKVVGGGITGQAEAIRHGVARALVVSDQSLRTVIKRAGYLTRDSRAKERKKPGFVRARKRKQYTKR